MEALRTHVAGVDVHKEILAITVLIGDRESEPKVEQFECTTFTAELVKCGIKLKEMGVKDIPAWPDEFEGALRDRLRLKL